MSAEYHMHNDEEVEQAAIAYTTWDWYDRCGDKPPALFMPFVVFLELWAHQMQGPFPWGTAWTGQAMLPYYAGTWAMWYDGGVAW